MADSWKTHDSFSTEDGRFRISIQSPVEEPQSFFLDLRRAFEKNGEFLCTKRGIRVQTSTAHLHELEGALEKITRGEVMLQESAGMCLNRRGSKLRIRKKTLAEGEVPIFIVLNPSEAVFLLSKLSIIYGNVSDMEAESDDEEGENWLLK